MNPRTPEEPEVPAKVPESSPVRKRISRRTSIIGAVVALLLLAAPWLRLGETVARAERRRRNHRGHSDELWIGHC